MTSRHSMWSLLLTASLLLAAAGQYYFARRRQYLWDGVVLYSLACFLFLVLVRRMEGQTRSEVGGGWGQRLASWLRASPWRTLSLAASGTGSLGTLYLIDVSGRGGSYRSPFILWLVSIFLYASAFWDLERIRRELAWLVSAAQTRRLEVLLVVACTVAGFALRAVNLETIPYVLSGDEASMGLEAVRVIQGDLTNMFATGWLSHPTLFFFIQSLSLQALGQRVWALRLPSVLAATLTLPLFYLLMRQLFDRTLALVAMGILTAYHFHIHYGRMGMNNIEDGLFVTAVLLCLVRGVRIRGRGCFIAAGLALGFSQYFYMGARLIPILVAALVAFWTLRVRAFLSRHVGDLVTLTGAFLVVALPILAFWWTHPADFAARISQLGILQSGWLARERELTGRSTAYLLGQQLLRSALAFNYYPDPTFHYRPGIPLLGFLPSIFFVFGLAYALAHLGEGGNMVLGLWLSLALIFGSVLMENPPSSMRLVILSPVLCALVALGLVKVVTLARQALALSRRASSVALVALVLLIGVLDVHFYFQVYTPKGVYGGPNTQVADRMGQYLHSLGRGWKAYMLTPPRIYSNFATIPFRAPEVPRYDVIEPLTEKPDFVDPSYKAAFLFLPEREAELAVVRSYYPHGTLRRFPGHRGPPLLFLAYEVEPP